MYIYTICILYIYTLYIYTHYITIYNLLLPQGIDHFFDHQSPLTFVRLQAALAGEHAKIEQMAEKIQSQAKLRSFVLLL